MNKLERSAMLMAKQSIEQENNNETTLNSTKQNKSLRKYTKKELMAMPKQERIRLVLDAMENDINQQKKDNPEMKGIRPYLADQSNQLFHFEIIKHNQQTCRKYNRPEDFYHQALQYFQLCFKHGKLPTIVGLATYTGISYSSFLYQMNFQNELLHDVCAYCSDVIHDMTLNATLDGKIKPELYNSLAEMNWNKRQKNGNLVVINNNSNQDKNDVLDALEYTMQDLED